MIPEGLGPPVLEALAQLLERGQLAGVLLRNEFLARSLREQFESLCRTGGLVKLTEG